TLTLGGALSGTADLSKDGTGRLLLNAAASYVGTTTITDGTLAIGVTNAVPITSPLVVNSSNSFDLNGFAQTVPSLTGIGTVTNSAGGTAATLTVDIAGSAEFDGILAGNLN